MHSRKMAKKGAPKADKKQPKCQPTVLELQKLIKSSRKKEGIKLKAAGRQQNKYLQQLQNHK